MERYVEMEEYIEDYRRRRMNEREEYLVNHYNELLSQILTVVAALVHEQEERQELEEQGKIKNLSFYRLLSSGYTGSYELSVEMSNAMLYLDEHASCIYWKPEEVYKNIDEDMEEIRQLLNKKYVQIEEYELLRLKQKLLLDDWNLLCGVLGKMAEGIAAKIRESALQLEDENQILCGDYMDQLEVIYRFKIEN